MTPIPDTRSYFFLHQNNEGYVVGLKKNIAGYYSVVILDGESELLTLQARKQNDIAFLYETMYQWLAFSPGDIPKKCQILKGVEDLYIAFQRLPLAEVSITIPDLKQMEFEEFKQKVKK